VFTATTEDARRIDYPSIDGEGTVYWRKADGDNCIWTSYVKFIQRYASTLMGSRRLNTYFKAHPNHTIFDALNPSDEAFACLVLRNNYKLWRDQYRKVAKENDESLKERGHKTDTGSDLDSNTSSSDGSDDDNDNTVPGSCGPKYTGVKTRAKNKYLQSGWSEKGKKYYKIILTNVMAREREKTDIYRKVRQIWVERYGTSFHTKTDDIMPQIETDRTQTPRLPALMFPDEDNASEEGDINIVQLEFL